MNQRPKWISEEIWICRAHVPAPHLPAMQETCWYCGEKRPPLPTGAVIRPFSPTGEEPTPEATRIARRQQKIEVQAEIEAQNLVGTEPCGWAGCSNKARNNSRYCSRECSNKNARARHAQRKKSSPGLKIGDLGSVETGVVEKAEVAE